MGSGLRIKYIASTAARLRKKTARLYAPSLRMTLTNHTRPRADNRQHDAVFGLRRHPRFKFQTPVQMINSTRWRPGTRNQIMIHWPWQSQQYFPLSLDPEPYLF